MGRARMIKTITYITCLHALVTCPGMGGGKGTFTLATDQGSA